MRRPIRPIPILLSWAALLALPACNGAKPAPGSEASPASPAFTVSPSSCATCPAPYGRWASIVLYREAGGACKQIAGPPRVGAHPGELVTWRITNKCTQPAPVKIGGFKHFATDPGVPPAGQDYNEQGHDPSPLQGTDHVTVAPNQTVDLPLTVKPQAPTGVYTYVVALGGSPDPDQQLEIWP